MSCLSSPKDAIIIRDMEVMMSVGILEHEKQDKQRVIINVEIGVKPHKGAASDDIGTVLSYADVVNDIERIAADGHTNLVERLAECIADAALKHDQALATRVRVEKPDIFKNIAGVGVEIIRVK